jgi:lipopolysaccharide transport system ATP-binding protein
MKDVSAKEGRTVLFVSHNMTAIKNLCTRAIFLKQGQLVNSGPAEQVVSEYLSNEFRASFEQNWEYAHAPGNEKVKVKGIRIVPKHNPGDVTITPETPINVEFEFWNEIEGTDINLSLHLYNVSGEVVFNIISPVVKMNKGLHTGTCYRPGNLLNDDYYSISMMIVKEGAMLLFNLEHMVSFEVHETREASGWHGKWGGYVRPKLEFDLQ